MVNKNTNELGFKSISTEKVVKFKKKHLKKSKKRVRRRRGKVKYFKNLRKRKLNQRSEELCSAVEFVQIKDMDWTPTTQTYSQLPSEVIEWQKQDQIAYWKSRAISLEYENRMLKQHLRNVYTQTIEDNCDRHISPEASDEGTKNEDYCEQNTNRRKKSSKENEEISPKLPELKNRLTEMEKIFGKKAPKILGMETALQLNYERYLEKTKPVTWPTLPLRMDFKNI